MNVHEIYTKLIDRAKVRVLDANIYREQHHIIPRCLGGEDCKENIVELTSREHYIAHLLLCKIYPHNNKLAFAFKAMCVYPNNGCRVVRKSRVYEQLRLKGRFKHTDEAKQKMRRAKLGKKYDEIHGKEKAIQIRERKKLNTGSRNPNFKALDVYQIKHLIDEGKTIKEIGLIINSNYTTISNRFKDQFNISISEYTDLKGITKNGSRLKQR